MRGYVVKIQPREKAKAKERLSFLRCMDCNTLLQMAEYRTLYCPKCKKGELENPTMVLHCEECKNPLQVTSECLPKYASYCKECGFHPSMQDTCFHKI